MNEKIDPKIQVVTNPQSTTKEVAVFQGRVLAVRGEIYKTISAMDASAASLIDPEDFVDGIALVQKEPKLREIAIEAVRINLKLRLEEAA